LNLSVEYFNREYHRATATRLPLTLRNGRFCKYAFRHPAFERQRKLLQRSLTPHF